MRHKIHGSPEEGDFIPAGAGGQGRGWHGRKGTCLLKWEGKGRGLVQGGEARGDRTQKGLKESEPVKSLSTTEKPVGAYSSAWPPSGHDATGDSSPRLVAILDQRDGWREGRCYDSQSRSVCH